MSVTRYPWFGGGQVATRTTVTWPTLPKSVLGATDLPNQSRARVTGGDGWDTGSAGGERTHPRLDRHTGSPRDKALATLGPWHVDTAWHQQSAPVGRWVHGTPPNILCVVGNFSKPEYDHGCARTGSMWPTPAGQGAFQVTWTLWTL